MNKIKIVTIICWIISAVALAALAFWFIAGAVPEFGGERMPWVQIDLGPGAMELRTTRSIPADGVDSIFVDWTAGNVNVSAHDGNEIQITEFSRRELREDEQLAITESDGELRINFREGRRLRSMQSKNLEVRIPRDIENFDVFSVNTVSGRVSIDDLDASVISISSVSGRTELNGVTARRIGVNTTSGRIEAHDTTAETMDLGTVSGRIEVVSQAVPESLNASTTSGRIEITVPGGEPIRVQYSTVSGRFSSAIPVITGGGNNARFNLSTVSGRISIYEF